MRLSISLNILLFTALVVLGYFYHRDVSDLEKELVALHQESAAIGSKEKIAELLFGYRKPTFKEESLFEARYEASPECMNPANDSVWVRCVETRKSALKEWLKELDGN